MATSAKLPRSINEQNDTDLKVEMVSVESLEAKHGDLTEFSKQSRRNIRDAKRAQEKDITDRISNWRQKKGKQTVSRTEVSRHNRKADAWVIVDGVVYDVTSFIDQHPGGPELLLKRAGQDVTQTFRDLGHSTLASYILSEMYVGDLPLIERVAYDDDSGSEADEASSDDDKNNPVVDLRPKHDDTELASVTSAVHTPQLARIDRPVPNRYRKRPANGSSDKSNASPSSAENQDGTVRSSDGTGAGSGSGAGSGGVSVMPVRRKEDLPRAIPSMWQLFRYSLTNPTLARQLARNLAKALRQHIFLRRAQLLGAIGTLVVALTLWAIPLPPWLLGHPAPDGSSVAREDGSAGAGLPFDRLHDRVTAKSDRSALPSVPPPGHDAAAVLYF